MSAKRTCYPEPIDFTIPQEMRFYEHRLDRPMDLFCFFEMKPSDRTEYLAMLQRDFNFELSDYVNFFHTTKVGTYKLLKEYGINLKRTGGMSGSQSRAWKKFISQTWEHCCRSNEVLDPVYEEIKSIMGVAFLESTEEPPLSEKMLEEILEPIKLADPVTTSDVLGSIKTREESEEEPMPDQTLTKHVVIHEFNEVPPVRLSLDLVVKQSFANELLESLYEHKLTGPRGDIVSISISLPPANSH